MHPALQLLAVDLSAVAVGGVAAILTGLVGTGIAAMVRWAVGAAKRDGVTESTASTLATAIARMEGKIDELVTGHQETREARVRVDGQLTTHTAAIEELKAGQAAIHAKIDSLDQRHIQARHDLRDSLHGPNAVTEVVAAIKAQGEATTRAAAAMEAVARSLTEAPRAARPARGGR